VIQQQLCHSSVALPFQVFFLECYFGKTIIKKSNSTQFNFDALKHLFLLSYFRFHSRDLLCQKELILILMLSKKIEDTVVCCKINILLIVISTLAMVIIVSKINTEF